MIIYWHNPRCSKSRAGLELLQEAGAEVTLRRYLDDPPTRAELRAVQGLLGLPVAAMMRQGEALFRDLGLGPADAEDDLLTAMAAHPALIERPIAHTVDRAVIGRPTQALRHLL